MHFKTTLFYLVLLVLLTCKQTALGAVLFLDNKLNQVNPQSYLEWFMDTTGELEINDLSEKVHIFTKTPRGSNYPRTDKAYWFHLTLQSQKKTKAQWLLELSYTQLDTIDFYSRTGKGPWRQVSTGDKKTLSSRDIQHPLPVFKIALQPGVPTEIFLRVKSSTSILVPLSLWTEEAFYKHNMSFILINGLVYGVLIALIFYNLFLYPTVLDSTYLWFSLYLSSLFLFQFSFDGFSAFFLWPDSPVIIDRIAMFSLWLTIATGLRFTQLIGHMKQFTPRLNQLFHGLSMLCFILALIVAFSGPAITLSLLPPVALLTILFIPFALWRAWQSGYQPARYAFYAFFPQMPGAALLIARILNWIDTSFWSENLFIIGTALSSILLSFALADRINSIRNDNQEAQARLLESERSASKVQQQFSQKLIEAQDNERRRIAAELHDGIGQNLSFLANTIKRLYRKKGIAIPDSVNEAAREAVDEVRSISHQLHPHLLDKLGLVAAIEAIAQRTQQQSGIRCIVTIDESALSLSADTELHLYRIAQEALNNVAKHSNATQVELSLGKINGKTQFTVVDNGQGRTNNQDTSGLGLQSISERAKLLGGDVIFSTLNPHGFKITLSIPAEKTV